MLAALGSQVDDPVGGAYHIEVVLDHEQRMTGLEQQTEGMHQPRNVLEMKSGGRLIEDQQLAPCAGRRGARLALAAGAHRAAERGLGQVSRELEPLRLTAAQGRHRLTETHVVEADIDQRLQARAHGRRVGKECQRLGRGHLQHLGDAGSFAGGARESNLQRLGAVAAAVAFTAAQVHIRQELHLDVLEAVAGAGRAAPGAGVEAEGAGGIAPQLRLGSAAKRARISSNAPT